jgi:hypothetical protein
MGFLSKMGEIILFTIVTIFQRFFSLCIVYGSIIPPEYIYYDYLNYAITHQIMIP